MRIVIWIVCVFIASAIKVALYGSSSPGAIPMLIIYGAAMALAGTLTSLWNKYKENEAAEMSAASERIDNQTRETTVIDGSADPPLEIPAQIEEVREVPVNDSEPPEPPCAEELPAQAEQPPIVDSTNTGIAIEEPSFPPVRFCMKCGFELLPDSVFCSKCGTRIQQNTKPHSSAVKVRRISNNGNLRT